MLPTGRDLVLAPCSSEQAAEMLEAAKVEGLLDSCLMIVPDRSSFGKFGQQAPVLAGSVDPWHVACSAGTIWTDANQELALVTALVQRPVRIFGQGQFSESANGPGDLIRTVGDQLAGWSYRCPYSGGPISPIRAIEILAEWRKLIDSNRDVAAVFGVAQWKRPTVDPLLWDGFVGPTHARRLTEPQDNASRVIAWKSRTAEALLTRLEQSGLEVAELEDGMIRGHGLGANCVPPLSIVVDFSGIYFDPSKPSDLERILESADFDDDMLDRAARLRARVVEAGISKYGSDAGPRRESTGKRQILVVGQVEDDRSIVTGGGGQTNLELLQRARSIEPDSWLIYRPHPDVEAGHRRGHIVDEVALRHADEIDRSGSIGGLIKSVDEVHCITSLAGFEALLRGKPVTTHGVPFYAGWGLTRDLDDIPRRRTRRRSLDELVAATLIVYPRYIDPVSRLPCPPEILVERMARGEGTVGAPLTGMRKLQGKMKVALRRLRETVS